MYIYNMCGNCLIDVKYRISYIICNNNIKYIPTYIIYVIILCNFLPVYIFLYNILNVIIFVFFS